MSSGAKVFKKSGKIFLLFKGVFASLVISVVGILVFAVVLKFVDINETVIKIVNQVIKIVSVFFGVKIGFKNLNNRSSFRIFCGFFIGVTYTLLSYLLFSIFVSSFSFGLSFLLDCIFAGGVGVVFALLK